MSLLRDLADKFEEISPAGCYIGLRVGFSFPAEELNRLPPDWVDFYSTEGLVVFDPVMKWVYSNQGKIRWRDINLDDPCGVFDRAADFGLRYGAVVSVTDATKPSRRSYGNFMRADREFHGSEMDELYETLLRLHAAGSEMPRLTAAEIEALRLQLQGLRLKQIAAELNISISAVKARLSNAKRKLGAQTSAQAASIALTRGLLQS